jgi:flagellar basal-body rod protein FlgB
MAISLDKLVGFHHKALNVRSQKMEVIAGNLANANTPGYKAKDINFKQAMESVSAGQSTRGDKTHYKHYDIGQSMQSRLVQYRSVQQPDTGDGNTVDAQVERNHFLDNGMRYQASLQFLSGKFKGMKKALSGGQ